MPHTLVASEPGPWPVELVELLLTAPPPRCPANDIANGRMIGLAGHAAILA